MTVAYEMTHLEKLEAEAVQILREVAATAEKPALLFSGGKDSVVMLHLAVKAFWPAPVPFPVMHVDTGQNFDAVIAFRDSTVDKHGLRLIVAHVQDDIDAGRVHEDYPGAARNRLQTVTLLRGINENHFGAVFGGARRDEEKARAKERFFSFRDEFGQWDPRNQRPEIWNLYNARVNPGEHMRVFPLSNWTELDIWEYIGKEKLEVPSIYFSHRRRCFRRNGQWLPVTDILPPKSNDQVKELVVRVRTIGDIISTGMVESPADSVDDIITEIAAARVTERGSRADDKASEAAMEDRKKAGYF